MNESVLSANVRGIRSLSWGYWRSHILFAGVHLGIFDLLRRRPLTAKQVARRLRLSERGTHILLRALAALRLLNENHGTYSDNPAARELLTKDGAHSMVGAVHHCLNLMRSWAALERCVRTGKPYIHKAQTPRELAHRRADFMQAMEDNARLAAHEVYRKGGLSKCRRFLDVGCGPATYAIEFARRNPELHGTLVDIPAIAAIAKKKISQAGLAARLSVVPGDFRKVEFAKEEHDVAFVSHVIHMYDGPTNRRLLKKIRQALRPSGRLLIHDYVLDNDSCPEEAAIFAVNMLVGTCGGNCPTRREVSEWLERAGFGAARFRRLQTGTCLILAIKR